MYPRKMKRGRIGSGRRPPSTVATGAIVLLGIVGFVMLTYPSPANTNLRRQLAANEKTQKRPAAKSNPGRKLTAQEVGEQRAQKARQHNRQLEKNDGDNKRELSAEGDEKHRELFGISFLASKSTPLDKASDTDDLEEQLAHLAQQGAIEEPEPYHQRNHIARPETTVQEGQPGLAPEFDINNPLGAAPMGPLGPEIIEADDEIVGEMPEEAEDQPAAAGVGEEPPAAFVEIVEAPNSFAGDCKVLQPHPPAHKLTPTFCASFPGSGAKMSWNLISGLTGIQTGDDHRINNVAWDEAITVKTHYPHPEGNPNIGVMMERTGEESLKYSFPRAMVVLRHPMAAIPGYHNFLYEIEHGLVGHSTRAPLDEWVTWRNANFESEMDKWVDHTCYWLNHYGSRSGGMSYEGTKVERQIVSYEGMVSESEGPANALALARFLDNTAGVDVTTDPETVSCVWQKVIKYKGQDDAMPVDGDVKDPESKRSGDSFRPYTVAQLDYMIQRLEDLYGMHSEDRQLRPILDVYIAMTVDAKIAMIEEEAAKV